MKYTHNNQTHKVDRYPATNNRSLRSWNAADELTLITLDEMEEKPRTMAIAHDRFGWLGCYLHSWKPVHIITYKSQEKALRKNLKQNKIPLDNEKLSAPLSALPEAIDMGIMKVPKNMDLFEVYLQQMHAFLKAEGTLLCGFMTKHFTPQMLEIADRYFEQSEQTMARKKARLLVLKGPKKPEARALVNTIDTESLPAGTEELKQFYGVFSSEKIDLGSRFLMKHLNVADGEKRILDLACGNGILGFSAHHQQPEAEVHFLDDNRLAVDSARRNAEDYFDEKASFSFYFEDSLEPFPNTHFDLVISNPPFHFGHENNIEVAIRLFGEVHRCLNKKGRFLLVASKHLNFSTHLENQFSSVRSVAGNKQYEVIEAIK